MSPLRAKDVTFAIDDQANQTMVLDLEPASTKERTATSSEEPTLVLDLSATQVRELLEDAEVKR
jgi:hypothetical protein